MPPATIIFMRNFGRIIGLIIEGLIVRIRLFSRMIMKFQRFAFCLPVTTSNLGNRRTSTPRRIKNLEFCPNNFTLLPHGDLCRAEFAQNRFRNKRHIIAGLCKQQHGAKVSSKRVHRHADCGWPTVTKHGYAPTANQIAHHKILEKYCFFVDTLKIER